MTHKPTGSPTLPSVSYTHLDVYKRHVQTQVIANVANMYYTLLILDRQLQISESTCDILKRNLETVEAMKEAGTKIRGVFLNGRRFRPSERFSMPELALRILHNFRED